MLHRITCNIKSMKLWINTPKYFLLFNILSLVTVVAFCLCVFGSSPLGFIVTRYTSWCEWLIVSPSPTKTCTLLFLLSWLRHKQVHLLISGLCFYLSRLIFITITRHVSINLPLFTFVFVMHLCKSERPYKKLNSYIWISVLLAIVSL